MSSLDHLEIKVAKFLRYGVLVAGTIIAIGWLTSFNSSEHFLEKYRQYDPIPLQNFLIYHYGQGEWGILTAYAGLAVLISLPLIRVFLTALLFLKSRDFTLAAIAGLVLLGLIISFTFGLES